MPTQDRQPERHAAAEQFLYFLPFWVGRRDRPADDPRLNEAIIARDVVAAQERAAELLEASSQDTVTLHDWTLSRSVKSTLQLLFN